MSRCSNQRMCDDTCDNCIYIGEGDFICDLVQDIVISDWIPVYGKCIKNKWGTKDGKCFNK